MKPEKYGVTFEDHGIEIVSLSADQRWGWWFLVRGKRQEVEIRVTPSGLLRVGNVKPAGPIRSTGVEE